CRAEHQVLLPVLPRIAPDLLSYCRSGARFSDPGGRHPLCSFEARLGSVMLDWPIFVSYLPLLIRGATTTVELTFLVVVFGFAIALPVALGRNAISPLPRIA